MIRRSTLAFLLFTAACTSSADPTTTTTSTTTTTTTLSPVDPGRLAVLDDGGNVLVMDPDGANRLQMTTDGGESTVYAQPVWSPDGETLAWGQVDSSGFAVGIQSTADDEPTTVSTANLPFYMSWSPDGTRLGVLHNGTSGVAFALVDVAGASLQSIDEDAPFYFSWDPAGEDLVTHAGVDRVAVIDAAGEATSLEDTDASYLAPHWTEEGAFHAVDGAIVLETADGRGEVAALDGLAMFVANPQGTLLAVQTTGPGAISVALADPPTIPGGAVVVIDLETGETHQIDDELALGFFWSPDGGRLLVLTPSEQSVTPLVWSHGGSSEEYPAYSPPVTMLQDTFPFFPQYAQSVSFWAPDSTAFAYAGEVGDESGVWVQTLTDSDPVRVSSGRWVAWSGPRGGRADQ